MTFRKFDFCSKFGKVTFGNLEFCNLEFGKKRSTLINKDSKDLTTTNEKQTYINIFLVLVVTVIEILGANLEEACLKKGRYFCS
jgi:hypothetical protein